MLSVKVEEKTNFPDIAKAFELMLFVIPDRVIDQLETIVYKAVKKIVFTKPMLEKWPFFANVKKFVKDYISCIRVWVYAKDTSFSIEYSSEKAEEYHFPHDIHMRMEYGTSSFPVCPHFRVIRDKLASIIKFSEFIKK